MNHMFKCMIWNRTEKLCRFVEWFRGRVLIVRCQQAQAVLPAAPPPLYDTSKAYYTQLSALAVAPPAAAAGPPTVYTLPAAVNPTYQPTAAAAAYQHPAATFQYPAPATYQQRHSAAYQAYPAASAAAAAAAVKYQTVYDQASRKFYALPPTASPSHLTPPSVYAVSAEPFYHTSE